MARNWDRELYVIPRLYYLRPRVGNKSQRNAEVQKLFRPTGIRGACGMKLVCLQVSEFSTLNPLDFGLWRFRQGSILYVI